MSEHRPPSTEQPRGHATPRGALRRAPALALAALALALSGCTPQVKAPTPTEPTHDIGATDRTDSQHAQREAEAREAEVWP